MRKLGLFIIELGLFTLVISISLLLAYLTIDYLEHLAITFLFLLPYYWGRSEKAIMTKVEGFLARSLK